ncbi:MAG TPA: enolase C-terminal domain-like protein [Microthrixaceae bacterium]|nr:enolase C-terminal domain-like protein [Microthrixaceae bacterium]
MNATGATITSLTVVPMRLRFHEPFAVTSGVRTHLDTVLVRLTASDGTVGWGEASPDEGVTGESPTACVEALGGVLAEAVTGRGVDDVDALGSSIDDLADGAGPAARAAVDIAVHDAAARRRGLPLWRFLEDRIVAGGGTRAGRNHLQVSRVVSMDDPEVMAVRAATHVRDGFSTVKLKVGDPHDWRRDVERVVVVRAAVGPDVGIKVDVNQGWRTAEVAVPAVAAMAESRPLFVEQPVDRRDLAGLAEVRRQVPQVPIMADEAVGSAEDLGRIVALGAADIVNLKVMRLGGLRAAIAADAVAGVAGMRSQIGTMIESSIGSAAGLHLATALANVAFVEMGGPLMLAEDPGDLGRCYRGETVTLPDGPGLGVTPRPPSRFS